MALRVGVKDKEKFEQFTEAQKKFIPSFGGMGLMCMTTGVGHIHKRGEEITYGVSIEEAYRRFALYDKILHPKKGEGASGLYGDWYITLEFVEQLADADFTCNVSTKSNEECDHALAYMALNRANDSLRNKAEESRIKEIHKYDSISRINYREYQELKTTAKSVIDTWLRRSSLPWHGENCMDEYVAEFIDNMSLYEDYHWDEETYKYSLKVEENLTNPL
tara:strand:+ start:150 stop:809 length:660 start_codon:yes stop_codon:yes gene_type:complete